jgi:hypothetical protein
VSVHCGKCGARLASRARLEGHLRRAHSKGRKVRRSAALVPVKSRPARPEPIRAEVLDLIPTRSEIVPAPRPVPPSKPSPRNILTPDLRDAEPPPSWWEPQADLEWRVRQWNAFPADYRNRLLAQRAGAAFTIRAPQATDATILLSQYHALKALATRLDAGIGSERERAAFEAGLREYNANYDRVRTQRRALPG